MEPIGLIGYGGIAKTVLSKLKDEVDDESVVTGILVRAIHAQADDLPFVTDVSELLRRGPRVVVECAGHEAVSRYGAEVLEAGVDLVLVSTGALADADVYDRLQGAAREGRSRLILPAGAVGGVDALVSARLAGLHSVTYRGRKPPEAWKGPSVNGGTDYSDLTEPKVIYRGTARDAALSFPKNSNVAATVALAGLGFDETAVELIADPTVGANVHEIDVKAESGDFSISLMGKQSASNPRTSMLTAYSIVRTLLNLERAVVI